MAVSDSLVEYASVQMFSKSSRQRREMPYGRGIAEVESRALDPVLHGEFKMTGSGMAVAGRPIYVANRGCAPNSRRGCHVALVQPPGPGLRHPKPKL